LEFVLLKPAAFQSSLFISKRYKPTKKRISVKDKILRGGEIHFRSHQEKP
jgi:hypothetical protein